VGGLARARPLSNRGLDYLVASLRSVTGLIPGAGPFVSELLTVIIPNQRIDRIRDFVRILDSKLQKFKGFSRRSRHPRTPACAIALCSGSLPTLSPGSAPS